MSVGGTGDQLPSFPGAADKELQVIVLRSLYQALPEHFRRAKNAKDANTAAWRTNIGLTEAGACCLLPTCLCNTFLTLSRSSPQPSAR